jgi:beta-RFAP synthase
MDRGARSGIGIAAFEQGGFVVDAGRRMNTTGETVSSFEFRASSGLKQTETRTGDLVPRTIVRYPFPEEWTFVVAIPHVDRGLAGVAEVDAFGRLALRPATAAGRLSRILLMQMLPAVLERDPVVFGEALTRIQRIVGNWFRSVQGGTFATTQGAELARAMRRAGALGVGQSSWGPAVYGLTMDQDQADHLKHRLMQAMQGKIEAIVFLAKASNRGAEIS